MNPNSFTNRFPITSFLLLLNVGLFVLQWISAQKLGDTTDLNEIGREMNANSLISRNLGSIHCGSIFKDGQYWRFISGTFLHGGIAHVLMNSWVLTDLGQFCEPRLSRSKFFSVYMLSALAGAIATYSWAAVTLTFESTGSSSWLLQRGLGFEAISFTDAMSVLLGQASPTELGNAVNYFSAHTSVGCSGALAGLIGMMLVYSIKERHAALRAMLVRWILMIALITFILPNIDHAGHLGGLVVGGICGLTMQDYATSKTSLRWRIPAGLAGLAMVWALYQAVHNLALIRWSLH